jgi:ATP-binding cassette subfamily B multidrug efflux pump
LLLSSDIILVYISVKHIKREAGNLIKLARYLKPFLVGLFMAVILLFVQALTNLYLPNYMSDIVDVGIQQNGIVHSAPDAISQSGLQFITTFMSDSDRRLVEANYYLVSSRGKNASGTVYSIVYPKTGSELYLKKSTDAAVTNELDQAFNVASWTFIDVMKSVSGNGVQKSTFNSSNIKSVDLKTLYQMQQMLSMLPKATIEASRTKALKLDQSILKQTGIMFSTLFYSELGADINAMQTAYIVRIGITMIVITLIGGVATILVSLLASRIAAGVAMNIRKDIFHKIENFANVEFDQFSTASLITRCTNDITQIQQLLMMGVRMIFYAPIMGIGGIFMAVSKSASMSWIIAVASVSLIGMIVVIMTISMPKFIVIQYLVDKLNLVSRENLSGMMVIRSFNAQEHEKKRFESANEDLTENTLFVNKVMAFMMPAMTLIMNGSTLLIVWVASHEIASLTMQVGDMMAFIQYVMQIIMAFLMISMMFIFIPRAEVSANRIVEVLGTKDSILDQENPESFIPEEKGVLEFRHVDFNYFGAERNALSDISFAAKPGQTTAIIGATGSGKSTIANLVLRLYDVTKGQILVDGVDIRNVRQKELRSIIGYVPQKGTLFSGTIASNLRYGRKEATDAEIETATAVAQAMEFISEKPDRFDSEISQGGTNVSGGQKQRLSIARALVKKPEIFVFDDSFSALDFKTDAALRKALKEHTGGSTVIMIGQRISTVMNAERIVVLDRGQIVGIGTHQELLKACPLYYEIALSQLSKEELA